MAILTYELRAIGEQDIARALASVERRFASHAIRINRALAIGGGSVRQRALNPAAASRQIVQSNQSIFKSFDADQKKVFAYETQYRRASLRQGFRDIESRKKEEIKAIRDVAREREREQKAARATFSRAVTGGAVKGVERIAAVGKAGLATLGVGGSVLAASSVTEALKLDELTRRLVINARGPGEAGRDPNALRKQIVNTGLETGIAPEQIAGGALKYVSKTGDLDTAAANLKNFAVVAQATGASVEDVASTAADLSQKFDIKNTKEMGDALAVLAFQGKKGAFELKDMAEQFPEMAAAAQRAGLKGVGGMRTLGGLAQIARQSTGSGAEASTAVQMMMTQLTAKAGDLHSGKAISGKVIDVFKGGDPTKAARDLPTVLAEVISKSHGNMTELSKLFDVRGIRAVSPMIEAYRTASDKAGGGAKGEEAGKKAVLDMIKDASESSGKFSDVQKDAADVQKASSIQLETAIMELKQAFADELMPTVKDLIPRVRELGPIIHQVTRGLVGLAKFAADNPFVGVGAIMAASITAELAKAQMGKLITAAFNALPPAVSALAASFVAARAYIDGIFAQGKQNTEDAAKSASEINDKAAAELEQTGKISPETAKQLAELDKTQRGTLAAGDAVFKEGFFDTAGRALNTVTGGKHNLQEGATLMSAASNDKYTDEVIRTRRLMMAADVSGGGKVGPSEVKAEEIGAAIGDAAVKKINGMPLNRGNAPSPVKG